MHLELKPDGRVGEAVISRLYMDGEFFCHILEDVKDIFPGGDYVIRQRKIVSPMTERYRARFSWFTWHHEIETIPGRDFVYIHLGNYTTDTEGCQLTGEWDGVSEAVWSSTYHYTNYYAKVNPLLDAGDTVTYHIMRDTATSQPV